MIPDCQGNKILDCDFHQGRTPAQLAANEQAAEIIWCGIGLMLIAATAYWGVAWAVFGV